MQMQHHEWKISCFIMFTIKYKFIYALADPDIVFYQMNIYGLWYYMTYIIIYYRCMVLYYLCHLQNIKLNMIALDIDSNLDVYIQCNCLPYPICQIFDSGTMPCNRDLPAFVRNCNKQCQDTTLYSYWSKI